jgi:phenylalanyl-tRNA synthetase alpha chain
LDFFMTLEEKTSKTLAELGVTDAQGVEALFAEVRAAMESQRQVLVSGGAASSAEREKAAKALRDRWLARKNGLLAHIDEKWLKPASKELKPIVGRKFNELRQTSAQLEIEALIHAIPVRVKVSASEAVSMKDSVAVEVASVAADLTLPGFRCSLGSIHPITRVQREIEDIFLGLGYSIETGPEVETTYYNFDALNIPATHPARDDMDSLYVDAETVLRTHTSPVQIRAMQRHGAPLYILAPGKAYRRDNPDATHSPMFHQVEGLAVDTDITFADLKGTLDFFCRKFFGEKVRTSFHPTYFPFTEPSGEVSISCFVCDGTGLDTVGTGCRTCKASGWIEVMGCGMIHPEVLRHGGVDPERYSGWAFGLGIDRFAMVKYDIHDIQVFFQSDMRFLEQF